MHPFIKDLIKQLIRFGSKATFVFVLILFLIFISVAIFSHNINNLIPEEKRTYTVSGEAKRYVVPDQATITVGTILDGTNVQTIQKQANDRINNAIDKIKVLGIAEEDIKTSHYDISPNYNYETSKITGYTINIALKVTIKNLNKEDNMTGKVITAASEANLNEVRSLSFVIENKEAILEELKLEAIDDAKSKKDVIANTAGLKLGDLVDISFNGDKPYYYVYDEAGSLSTTKSPSSESASDITIQPGTNELSVTVTLYYEIL